MKLTLTYSVSVPDSWHAEEITKAVREMGPILRFYLSRLLVHNGPTNSAVSISLVKFDKCGPNGYDVTGFDGCDPEPILESDLKFIRDRNRKCASHPRDVPFDVWPKWAKDEAQCLANYRRAITLNILNS